MHYLKTRDYVILLDTGSSINLISKSYVYRNKEKFRIFKEKFEFNTASGKTKGNEFTFVKIDRTPIKCFLFDFHKDFNVLIGAPTLRELKLIWDAHRDLIKINDGVLKLNYFGENVFNNELNKVEVQRVEIRSNHFNQQERIELEKLIKEYYMLFPKKGDTLSHTSIIKHKINTTDEVPTYTRQY